MTFGAFEEYRPTADALGPGIGAGAFLTPREIVDSRRQAGHEPAELGELVRLVELAAYGPELPSEENIDEIRRKAAAMGPASPTLEDDAGHGRQKRATIPHER